MNLKLYKICHETSQFSNLGLGFEAWDNLDNLAPDLREFPVFEKAYRSPLTKTLDYWGLVSPKFEQKTNITGEQFTNWIEKVHAIDPKDVYFINPVPIVEAIFPGTVQHGNNCHPGLLDLLQRNITDANHINLSTLYMDINTFSMCNYFVGNRKFWDKYIDFVKRFIWHLNTEDYDMVYNTGANYGPNKSLPYYTFAVERLFSIFLNIYGSEIKFANYRYDRAALLDKTKLPEVIVDELIALSDIKAVALTGRNPHMLQHWAFYRNRLCQQNQYLFHIE